MHASVWMQAAERKWKDENRSSAAPEVGYQAQSAPIGVQCRPDGAPEEASPRSHKVVSGRRPRSKAYKKRNNVRDQWSAWRAVKGRFTWRLRQLNDRLMRSRWKSWLPSRIVPSRIVLSRIVPSRIVPGRIVPMKRAPIGRLAVPGMAFPVVPRSVHAPRAFWRAASNRLKSAGNRASSGPSRPLSPGSPRTKAMNGVSFGTIGIGLSWSYPYAKRNPTLALTAAPPATGAPESGALVGKRDAAHEIATQEMRPCQPM